MTAGIRWAEMADAELLHQVSALLITKEIINKVFAFPGTKQKLLLEPF